MNPIKPSARTGNDSFYAISNPKGAKMNLLLKKKKKKTILCGEQSTGGGCEEAAETSTLSWGNEMRSSEPLRFMRPSAVPGWWGRWCYWLAWAPLGHETPHLSTHCPGSDWYPNPALGGDHLSWLRLRARPDVEASILDTRSPYELFGGVGLARLCD